MPDTKKLVTLTRIKTLLDAYGATLDFWPEEERAAATALIETSSEARMLVEEAAALDSLLDQIPQPEVSAALTSRVRTMALPVAEANTGGLFARLAAYLRPQSTRGWQSAMAMAGVFGMAVGIGLTSLVLDRAAPVPQIIATATPLTTAPVLIVLDEADTNTASLAPNINALSLTGEKILENTSDFSTEFNGEFNCETANNSEDNGEIDTQSDIDEFTIASVPLY